MKKDDLKVKIKERYGKIALVGNSDACCSPQECCNTADYNPKLSSIAIGYDDKALESLPESSILGLGCGAPVSHANLKQGETIVDLGSGAGIDVFLASTQVGHNVKVIGIDFTDDMLDRARKAAIKYGFSNTEFRKADIEKRIPVEDNSVDAVISNCVINLMTDKTKAFKEVYRILKKAGKGRMIISDLVTSKEVASGSVNAENWCSCVDGALTQQNYIQSIKDAGFQNVEIVGEKNYLDEEQTGGRKITSLTIKAVTGL